MSVATRALEMTHDQDPKKVLWNEIKDYIDDVEVLGPSVLVATYIRPEKTKGGIIISGGDGHTRDEDIYQGKVQLLVKLGPDAFKADGQHTFTKVPEIGDWVVIRVSDSLQFKLGKTHCRFVVDSNIRAILKRPDIVL